MQTFAKLTIILFLISTGLQGQDAEIDSRLNNGELKMTFPSIYFKHNSTDYNAMPYTVDSCFKYIAKNIKNLNSFPIWRDSSEIEKLTNKRIKKLKNDVNKYTPYKNFNIQSMGNRQKISRRTIHKASDNTQVQYLLSLNSVFDLSGVIYPDTKKKKIDHKKQYFLWCPLCWFKPRSKGIPWRIFPKKSRN